MFISSIPYRQPRASHRPYRTEEAKLNALRYRSTRYHPTHLRANPRISDINPPRATPSVAPSHVDKAMVVPKEHQQNLLRTMGRQTGVLYRRQTLPASGHYVTFSVKTTDCDGRNFRRARQRFANSHRDSRKWEQLPNVGGTCAESSEPEFRSNCRGVCATCARRIQESVSGGRTERYLRTVGICCSRAARHSLNF